MCQGGRCSEENEAPDSVARADCVCVVRLILHLCYWVRFVMREEILASHALLPMGGSRRDSQPVQRPQGAQVPVLPVGLKGFVSMFSFPA